MADIDELDKILGDLCVTLETDQPREVRNEAIKETKQAIQNYALSARIEEVVGLTSMKLGEPDIEHLDCYGNLQVYINGRLAELKKQKEQV